MEPLTLQLRHDNEETIECWDDDGDLQWHEDIQFRTASSATSVTSCSIRRSEHRDSISSRRSAKSDLESNVGGDDDWQVQLLENDDYATDDAIASAQSAGIPLPANVPKSALIGGTIKRLGRKKPRKNFADDWSEDVEFPDSEYTLKLKDPKERDFPEILRQVNSTATSPEKCSAPPSWDNDISGRLHSALAGLAGHRDDGDVADFQDVPTIKLPKIRTPRRATPVNNDTYETENEVENLDHDFELPPDDLPIRLDSQKFNANSSSQFPEDLDLDWSEGSIGVRLGGTARDRRSNPSSSVSIASPSLSSCLTGESEDDNLDGLVIPDEPLDLETSLRKLQGSSTAAQPHSGFVQNGHELMEADDFFCGIEIEGGDIFTSNASLNPNVKCKAECLGNPARRSATTIQFTNTSASPKTRIPRLSGHDRSHSTCLETVSESGAPLSNFQRSQQSRLGGHLSHSSLSSLPAPGSMLTSPTSQPAGRRLVGTRVSKDSLLAARAPAGKQSLRAKRSMPAMRGMYQNAIVPSSQGTVSHQDTKGQWFKMPVDRMNTNRRAQAPFIPAGASENQSHHITVKNHRHARSSNDVPCPRGSVSRLARLNRTDSVGNNSSSNADSETIAAKRTVTKPARRQNFGDGTELELFDDLPTSSSTESRFIKHASGRGAPRSLRSRLGQSQNMLFQKETPQSPTPVTALKTPDSTPRFARDTNASRNAREQRIASMNMKDRETSLLPSLGANWKAQSISCVSSNSSATLRNKKRRSVLPGNKPHLIKPMGMGVQGAKCELVPLSSFLSFVGGADSIILLAMNGMRYNPITFRWEGNENLVQDFDNISPISPKPAPALITNVSAMQNVQVVGGMVFDPQRMCWLKLAPLQPGGNGLVAIQDEDDVFAGLDDLDDKGWSDDPGGRTSGAPDDLGPVASGDDRSGGESSDEWPITEEFDVGPEFVKRQRAEEEKWRRKVDKWVGLERRKLDDGWRWAIRDLVKSNGPFEADQFDDTGASHRRWQRRMGE